MFVNFFIRRPVFATVCSLLIILAGAVAIPTLPIAQFPILAPPQVTVGAYYTGANSTAVESGVTTLLEQAINGAEGMRYITSTSGNDGSSSITATFDLNRRPGHRCCGRAEPGVDGIGATARGSPADGRGGKQVLRFVGAGGILCRQQPVRQPIHQQLSRRLCARCTEAQSRAWAT